MALKLQASFSGGELDPVLRERVTLERYDIGLATARNVIVGKTGRLVSRPGTKYIMATYSSTYPSILLNLPGSDAYIETSENRFRYIVYDATTALHSISSTGSIGTNPSVYNPRRHAFVRDTREGHIYYRSAAVNSNLNYVHRIVISGGLSVQLNNVTSYFNSFAYSYNVNVTPSGPTGYNIDYGYTMVINGREIFPVRTVAGGPWNLPILAGESNSIRVGVSDSTINVADEYNLYFKLYRRPDGGGGWGLVGTIKDIASFTSGGIDYWGGTFIDVGQEADYADSPPEVLETTVSGITIPNVPRWNALGYYQNRLVLGWLESIYASRPIHLEDFSQDTPLTVSSAIKFKSGAEGYGEAKYIVDYNGMLIFTTTGTYISTGILSPTNLNINRIGSWISDDVEPLVIPGSVIFVDKSTNTVRELVFSETYGTYVAEDLSVFSDHLFRENRVKSWAFQQGAMPLLWVVFSDGTWANFTYEREQKMRAWTRCDSGKGIYAVMADDYGEIYMVKADDDGSNAYICKTVPRTVTAEAKEADSEWYMNESMAAMDDMVTWNGLLADTFTIAAVTPGDWEGSLTVTGTASVLTSGAGNPGNVGSVLRFFNPDDRTVVSLEVTARTNNNLITVTPSQEWPSDHTTAVRLYNTKSTFTGLTHLNGVDVAVIVDGAVVASPNNTEDGYPTLTPSGGSLTLPSDVLGTAMRGAIVHIGRPYVMDIETLSIATVEQRPVFIESKNVTKCYVKSYNSTGLFVGSELPDDDTNTGMQSIDQYDVDYEEDDPFVGNRFKQPTTKRREVVTEGDWDGEGKVCIRQVDPLHFEILSIIPDLQDLRRGE